MDCDVKRFVFKKLVRDKIPEVLRSSGARVVEHVMQHDEYCERLREKLFEEVQEVADARCTETLREELADVVEVLQAMASAHGIQWADVVKTQDQKRSQRGGFDGRILISFVDVRSGNENLAYFQAHPNKYPQANCV